MRIRYYAYVHKDLVEYFEETLDGRRDRVKVVRTEPAISDEGEPLLYYVLEAEEGVINSRWELKE